MASSSSHYHSRPPQSSSANASAYPPGTGTLTTIDAGNQPPDSSRGEGKRRTSFSFLRRGKSVEPMPSSPSTKRSGSTKLHKKGRDRAMSATQEPEPIRATPPVLPAPVRQPQMETFGGEDAVSRKTTVSPSNEAIVMGLAARARRHDSQLSEMSQPIDPYARTESMTHRGRYSYASSTISTINHPRKMRRRKDPTWFNILVVGAKDSGKTSFVNFLRASLLSHPRKSKSNAHDSVNDYPDGYNRASSSFTPHYLETDVSDGEKLGITIWDSAPLDRNLIDIQLREVTSFVESKFEETFTEEQRIVRSPGVRDTHIHCAFLVLDPANLDRNIAAAKKAQERYAGGATNGRPVIGPTTVLDAGIDFEILKALQGKTTVVPVISKADTVTTTHMAELKRSVFEALKAAGLSPFEAIRRSDDDEDDEEDDTGRSRAHRRHDSKFFDERDEETLDRRLAEANLDSRSSPGRSTGNRPLSAVFPADTSPETDDNELQSPYLPLSIISPETATPHLPGVKGMVGRQFPWGFADPYDEAHCDFGKLKQAVFCEWRDDIRIASRELWYETWRESRLRMPNAHKHGRASAQELPTQFSPRPQHTAQMSAPQQQQRQVSTTSTATQRATPRQNNQQQYPANYPYPVPPNAQNNPGTVGIAVSSAEDLHRHQQMMQSQARQRRPQDMEVGVAR